jgi:ribonuclease VapC
MILDASAVLAFLLQEPGQDVVADALLTGADMTSVALTEILTRYVRRDAHAEAQALRAQLPVTIIPVDEDLACRAAMMAKLTQSAGLSIGDRLCLALAQRSGQPVLTANPAWRDVADAVTAKVTLIR